MKKTTLEYRMMMEANRLKISEAKLSMGSIAGKFPISLDGGKTTIFIEDASREGEIRARYRSQRDSRISVLVKKPK